MTTSFRSLVCLSLRHLALISIRLMLGESSRKSGASCNLLQKVLRVFQRSGVMSSALRRATRGISVSAEMMRWANSVLLISKEKTTVVRLL